jgi:hypothetical protein
MVKYGRIPTDPLKPDDIKATYEMIRQYNDQFLVLTDDPTAPQGVKATWRPLQAGDTPLQDLRDRAAKIKGKYFNCRHAVTWEMHAKLVEVLDQMIERYVSEAIAKRKLNSMLDW